MGTAFLKFSWVIYVDENLTLAGYKREQNKKQHRTVRRADYFTQFVIAAIVT